MFPFRLFGPPNIANLEASKNVRGLIRALGYRGGLILGSGHRNWEIRSSAADSLGRIGGEQAIKALAAAIVEDANHWVRRRAAASLGKIGNARAAMALVLAIKYYLVYHPLYRDEINDIRQALGEIKDKQAVEALAAALKHENPRVRSTAIEELRLDSSKEAIETLASALKDNDLRVRIGAVAALGRCRSKAEQIDALAVAIKDKNLHVRIAAVESLGNVYKSFQSKQVAGMLVVASHDKDVDVRINAVRLLGQRRNQEAIDALAIAIKDEDTRVWSQATESLGQIGGKQAFFVLVETASHWELACSSEFERTTTQKALIQIGGKEAVVMALALVDSKPEVRRLAAEALQRIGDDAANSPQSFSDAITKELPSKIMQPIYFDTFELSGYERFYR